MSEVKFTEENKKTVSSFIAGLIVGGLLVYVFAMPSNDASKVVKDSSTDAQSEIDNSLNDSESEELNTRDTASASDSSSSTMSEKITLSEGDASVVVADQVASNKVVLEDVTFPTKTGWIGVRDYVNSQLTGLLGVARWSQAEGLYPTEVPLLRDMEAGHTYAIVFYSDNGDKEFNLSTDAQMEGVMETFLAE